MSAATVAIAFVVGVAGGWLLRRAIYYGNETDCPRCRANAAMADVVRGHVLTWLKETDEMLHLTPEERERIRKARSGKRLLRNLLIFAIAIAALALLLRYLSPPT